MNHRFAEWGHMGKQGHRAFTGGGRAFYRNVLEVVSKPQIRFKGKARAN